MASQRETAAVEVYTSNKPAMAREIEYKGMLLVSKVKSRNMFSDMKSELKSLVGGEIKGLSKLTADIREELLLELREKAVQAGANAIVGLRMETNSIVEGVVDMVVYGTAVYFHRHRKSSQCYLDQNSHLGCSSNISLENLRFSETKTTLDRYK